MLALQRQYQQHSLFLNAVAESTETFGWESQTIIGREN